MIRNKIYTAGAAVFLLFVILAGMNIWTHREVSSNLRIRDDVNKELAGIREFVKWKNALIRSVADTVASGHVSPFTEAQFRQTPGSRKTEQAILVTSGQQLVGLIAEKEQAVARINHAYSDIRRQVNTLYLQLDEKIATVLAIAQLSQVLGGDSAEQLALAPYLLKSLNQLTLVAMNGLISRSFSKDDESVVTKNQRFVSSQLHLIDPDGSLADIFARLFAQIESLALLTVESDKTLSSFEAQISKAKGNFDLTIKKTEIDAIVEDVQSNFDRADERLERASQRSLATVVIFLFIVPILVIAIGVFGLNTVIVGPITHLMDAMKHVEEGRFDVMAPIRAHDEIGELAHAFNVMAAEINAKVAEMSRLNQVLLESESKYKTLVNNLPQRIFLKDRNSVYVSCNRNFADDMNTTEEGIAGKTDFDLFSKDLAEKYRSDDARILLAVKPEEIEETYNKDGETIVVKTVKTPVRDEKGKVSGVLGIFWDITRSKEMEFSLRLSQFIFDKAEIAIFVMGENGEFLNVNEEAARYLGYSREELLAMDVFDVDTEFTPERWAEHMEDLRSHGAITTETLNRRKNGTVLPVQVIDNVMTFEEREFHVTFIQDITERKRDEEELRRLRNYLSNIIDSMPSVLVAVDDAGNVTQWNHQTEQATGLSFEKARSQPLARVFPRLADEMDRIQTAIRECRVISAPKVTSKHEHETRYEDITIFPLAANGVEGAVIRVDDVTEKVHLEEMMIQSEKMLSVGGLAAGMAHEINNPLAGMMQTAEVMAGRLGANLHLPASRKAAQAAGTTVEAVGRFMEARGIPRMLATITDSGRRVAAIVDNMLSFARKSEATVSSHAFEDLLDRTLELAATDYDLKKQYDFKRITVDREYAASPAIVPCEGGKIQQVVLNILRNGAEAMQEAGTEAPRFVFRTRVDPDADMAVMEIEDNGPGMDEQTRKRIFEPFFTAKPAGVGTGLGLSVSYFIVTENHRGEMAVESHPGAGAKFVIRLPMAGRR